MRIIILKVKSTPKKRVIVNKQLIAEIIFSSTILAFTMTHEVFGAGVDLSKLDRGGWALVAMFQRMIFWLSMVYTFKALLEVTVKGEGSWKKVGNGALICASSYFIPTLWQIIESAFK